MRRSSHGIARAAIVDFDVHHGNGSQEIFWADKTVMYCSTHQMPLFPGTGAVGEAGEHDTIVNAPLRPGDGGEAFRAAFESRILPRLRDFSPELVIISAGFDAHMRDPLANLNLVEDGFRLGDAEDHGRRRPLRRAAAWSRCSKAATIWRRSRNSAAAHVAALMQVRRTTSCAPDCAVHRHIASRRAERWRRKHNSDIAQLPFERAIEELESIVKRLEEGKVPLEESVAIYERGEALKRRCEDLLRQAEARVEKITLDATGKPTGTEPLDVE